MPADARLICSRGSRQSSGSSTNIPWLRAPGRLAWRAVGIARNEETLQAHTYLERLVDDLDQRLAMIIDPMLATGGSMVAAIDMLKKAGCKEIRALVLVAAPEGIEAVEKAHPDVTIYTASIDDRLDENGYIMPGLGDAGDKIFGTKQKDI